MILVIDESKKAALNLAAAFSYMGFLAIGATPSEAVREISPMYRAVVVTSPPRITSPKELVVRLRERSDAPVVAITDKPCDTSEIFDLELQRGAFCAVIAEKIIEYCDAHDKPIPGHYTVLGIDASADLHGATYFWRELPYTKTECMILRYLIRSYPMPASAERILKYAYRPSQRPDAANIRTHISIMNKKFKSVAGRSLIEAAFGEGYYLTAAEAVTV